MTCTQLFRSRQQIAHAFQREIRSRASLLLVVVLFIPHAGLYAQKSRETAFGVAWRVIGPWKVAGNEALISTGDAIDPGSLLQPMEGEHDHSITLLLPDGQRILYECFTVQDCVRGFRVPSLYRQPATNAIDLLSRVNAVLKQKENGTRSPVSDDEARVSRDESLVPRDEAVATLKAGNQVEVAGLAAKLSNGKYWYTVRSLSREARALPRREFEKSSPSIAFTLPSEGLFDVLIADSLNTPRIDLVVAALHETHSSGVINSFQNVQALLQNWNEDYQGWPVHEFQRDYLRSLLLDIAPTSRRADRSMPVRAQNQNPGAAAEPLFSPKPGVFRGDTEVVLRCDTPGATMHYTVDGSQPVSESAVYRAPIIVKGTELTIKAYATAKGKKDSPVVTGIFRIGD